jgi:Fur family ferric uptake transcriptional regulator
MIINITMQTRIDEAQVLDDYLMEKGLKMTLPRRTVLEVFLGIERHVSAESLFEAVRKVDPRIGQATVFRTIKLLEGAGLARQAGSSEGAKLYEHAFRHEHHDHLICRSCGKVVEFSSPALEKAQDAVYRKYGFAAKAHRLELYGICPACSRKKA